MRSANGYLKTHDCLSMDQTLSDATPLPWMPWLSLLPLGMLLSIGSEVLSLKQSPKTGVRDVRFSHHL